MPNKRAAHKKLFSVAFELDLLKRMEEYCKKHSINRVEFLKRVADKELKLDQKGKK